MNRGKTTVYIPGMRQRQLFMDTVAYMKRNVPGFEWAEKHERWTQRFIGFFFRWVFPINRHYMTKYTSTFYPRVYFPTGLVERDPWRATKILWHEYVHLFDAQRDGPTTFAASYMNWWSILAPIAIGLGIAMAVSGVPWPAFLSLSLALVPWPSPWRRDYELRGYTMNLVINLWKYGSIRESTVDWIVRQFTGPAYGWMWPFRKSMYERVRKIQSDIETGAILRGDNNTPYADAVAVLKAGMRQ